MPERTRPHSNDAVNAVARVLMAAWEEAEGKPVSASYVATFADMARAVLGDPSLPEVSDRHVEWGVRDDATGNVATSGVANRVSAEQWLQWIEDTHGSPSTLMRRERTTYRDHVTDWTAVEPDDGPVLQGGPHG